MVRGQATAYLFSGRPDPVWTVSEDCMHNLEGLWECLAQCTDSLDPNTVPFLGYRGCSVSSKGGVEFRVFNGIVTGRIRAEIEHRYDTSRSFERAILQTAPVGLLPEIDQLIDS